MDVSCYLFLLPDEFVELLELARGEGHAILYEPSPEERPNVWERLPADRPLPLALLERLRAPSKGSHLFHVAVDDRGGGAHPDDVDPHRLVAAYFGGLGDGVLRD